MKKWAIGIALVSSVGVAQAAESPIWNYAGASYISSDYGRETFDGFGVFGSKSIGENFFVSGGYASVSSDVDFFSYNIDTDLDSWNLGVGYRFGATDTTDVFGRISYQSAKVGVSIMDVSDSASENGYGLEVGVRSMLTDKLEIKGEIDYVDFDGSSEPGVGVGALYHFTDLFGAGASYSVSENVNTYAITAAFFF